MCGPGEKKCKTWATCEHNYGPMPSDVSLTSDALEAPVKTYAGGLVGSQVLTANQAALASSLNCLISDCRSVSM
jgi:hypothetical protein